MAAGDEGPAAAARCRRAITGISIDTRTIAPGEAFFAIRGEAATARLRRRRALTRRCRRSRWSSEARLSSLAERSRRCWSCRRRARRLARARPRGARAQLGARSSPSPARSARPAPRRRCGSRCRRQRRDACLGRLLQQSLGRAAVARALPADGALRRVRDRHEPCRRDRAADASWCGRMSRSSPRSSRCISNSSTSSRRSPTPRRRSSSASSRAAPPCSTATIRTSTACSARAEGAGVARIVSSASTQDADARLDQVRRCSRSARRVAGAHPRRRRSPTSSARPAATRASTRSRCWRRRRWSAPTSRWPRWRSARAAAADGPRRAHHARLCPGGSALLIDESYNANPASMRAALALLGQAPSRARAAGASRCSATCWSSGRSGAELHRGLADPIVGERGRPRVLRRAADARAVGGSSLRAPGRLCRDCGGARSRGARRDPRRRRGHGQGLARLEDGADRQGARRANIRRTRRDSGVRARLIRCSIGWSSSPTRSPVLNVFRYITFRTGGAMITALIFVFLFGPSIIDRAAHTQGKGQPIRDRRAADRTSSPRSARRPWAG